MSTIRTSPVRPAVQLMPAARGGVSPRTRTIAPNKATRKLAEDDKAPAQKVTFEDTLRSDSTLGSSRIDMTESLRNAPDLQPQEEEERNDFLQESLKMDRILTAAGKKARNATNHFHDNQLARSRLEHAMMYSEINLLPKTKAEIYNQLVDIREDRDRLREIVKHTHKSNAKANVMFKLEVKKTKILKETEIRQNKELRELRQHRREANITLKQQISDFENYKRIKQLEIVKLEQEKEMEKHKLQESLLSEQSKQSKHYDRMSESRERAHREAMEAKAEELAGQKALLERKKIEMENKFLNKVREQKNGFGSEKSMLQKKLTAARNHLASAREHAMSQKEKEMMETHRKETEKIKNLHIKALFEKDEEIRNINLFVKSQKNRIRDLEKIVRTAKVEMVNVALHRRWQFVVFSSGVIVKVRIWKLWWWW